MTKHIRKEHPNESIQEDQDADYSDVGLSDDDGLDDESDEIKDEPQDLYREPMEATEMHLTRRPSEYNRNLWALPGQSAQRPSPLHLDRMAIARPESCIQEIKLERHSSATPRRSLTDPFPDSDMDTCEYSLSRAGTMPNSAALSSAMPQSHANVSMASQFQLRNPDINGLWSPRHAVQDSPTSLTHSSPSSDSAQSHPMFTSQPYQLETVDLPSHEPMQYPSHHEIHGLSTIQQPLNDLTVHEIHLDEPQQQPFTDMSSTNQTSFDAGIQQHISQQDQFMAMSREASQHSMYDGPTPQSGFRQMQQYRDSMLATSTPKQQLSRFNTSLQDPPYGQSQYLTALGSLSTSNQAFPPNNAMFQYNHATTDWWKDTELEEKGWILPNQRVTEFDQWGS